ncbi:helix-turn-helix transcriptional regulator [Bacillus sp. DNRA2]|uniref:helix-turn-helix domain-containing protein n=1 Tax=Bacillus sp. DNRA2 TaxID=2723053 RepID=UPI00145E7020|nr:helix-turn-helix transcriptional regulator [Bacillus sp. DNRA2]NMD69599.1 helix-turn-helix transcriptional regulator [Bacillus sp. DNRA2]
MHLTANEFRMIRKVYRLSTVEYGALCDISGAYVNYIENNKRNLTDRVRRKLVAELQLTPDKLAQITAVYNEYSVNAT